MGIMTDNTKQKGIRKRIVEQTKVYENDKAILSAQVTESMRKSIDFPTLKKKLETAKANGLSSDWYVRLDKSIQALEIWFNIK